MPRRLLIVHESRPIRRTLRRQVLAELPDILVHEAGSSSEAASKLRCAAFELVLFDGALGGPDGDTPFEELVREFDPRPALVALVPQGTPEAHRTALRSRRVHALPLPIDGTRLAACLDAASDPRRMRRHRRVNVPGSSAAIVLGGEPVRAELINVSASGMLCEFAHHPGVGELFGPAHVTLELPATLPAPPLAEIPARAVHVSVLSRADDHAPALVRVAFQFVPLSSHDERVLSVALAGVAASLDGAPAGVGE